eukprot:2413552-Amphidinium_carterae.1
MGASISSVDMDTLEIHVAKMRSTSPQSERINACSRPGHMKQQTKLTALAFWESEEFKELYLQSSLLALQEKRMKTGAYDSDDDIPFFCMQDASIKALSSAIH